MTRVYNKLGSVVLEQENKDRIYLNPDDVRLAIAGDVFLINDGLVGKVYQLGLYTEIEDGSGSDFPTKEECENYLLGVIAASISIEDGKTEPQYVMKVIETSADETWTEIKWYASTDEGDTPMKTQTITVGDTPNTTPDPGKKTVIINS